LKISHLHEREVGEAVVNVGQLFAVDDEDGRAEATLCAVEAVEGSFI
jgi:hypothetical protein